MSASVSRPIRTMVSVSLALLFAGPGIAVAQRIEVEGRAWIPEISARAKIEGGSSSPGTPIDLGRDLGIDTEPLPELRLSIFTGPNSRLRLAYTHGRWDGDAIIGQGIEFNGTQFPAGSRVVSDLDLHYARLGWIWQPWLIPDRLRLGPILEAKAFVAEMTLEAPALVPRLKETEHVTVVVPTIGVAADFRMNSVISLFLEASGLSVGHPGYVVDAETGVRVTVNRFLSVAGGYRFFEIRGEERRSFAHLRLSGPFVDASLRF
ncbi:MAG: hypothetical protein AUI04_14195 [Candidatus Rokubacteria bacterium 13_2_20CM_2_64_8]|nr:MAG: hypothetical protein AUI04_14195 [Candidatus Rokubacteria bacterium 13_2_20CM_2_64_8]